MWLFQQLIELGGILMMIIGLYAIFMLILPDFFPPPKAHRDVDMKALSRLSELFKKPTTGDDQ